MLLATVCTGQAAPVIVGHRLRRGAAGSPRGAARMVADSLAAVRRLETSLNETPVLVRADAAFYGSPTINAAVRAGADVSVTVRMSPVIRRAIAGIGGDAWTPIDYPGSIVDSDTGELISRAEVAETGFTAFASQPAKKQVPGRLVVRRIPDLDADPSQTRCSTVGATTPSFTTTHPDRLDTVAVDRPHRQHAIIEQVHADLGRVARSPGPSFVGGASWTAGDRFRQRLA